MANEQNKISVEVAYVAHTGKSYLLALAVEKGMTVAEVISQSGILSLCSEIDLAKQKVGIFSKPCQLTDQVQLGDRIEIYRPLLIDPKEARRAKARRARGSG